MKIGGRSFLILTFSLAFTFQGLGSQENLYEDLNLGEKPSPLYTGPLSPEGEFDPLTGEFTFLDQVHEKSYLKDRLTRELFELADSWFHEFPLGAACSNFYLNQNIDYIRYLFRLITMSYIFESMKATNIALHQLGFDRNACSLSWHQTFSKCGPRSVDMKKFVKRVQYRFLDDLDRSEYVRLSEAEKKKWLDSLKDEYKKKTSSDIARARVIGQCLKEDKNCQNLKPHGLRKLLETSCDQDRQKIQQICSENDELYGLSYVDDLVELISQSHAINVIDSGGYGKNCLERFVSLFRRKETKSHYLTSVFPVIKKELKKKEKRYAQGSLFLPGALKEFDDKGLSDFLFRPEPEPEPEEPIVVIKKPEPRPRPRPRPAPKPEVRPEPEPVVVKPAPKPEPEPEPSEFAKAYQELVSTEASKVPMDMEAFKDDFIFSERMTKALREPLKDYQTRAALIDMKKFDLLGSKDEPVRLIFLKFLIDNNMHQGLFNITAVLGEEFYVVNDIDGANEAVAVELKNNEKTNYRWKMTLLREDVYREVQKEKKDKK